MELIAKNISKKNRKKGNIKRYKPSVEKRYGLWICRKKRFRENNAF